MKRPFLAIFLTGLVSIPAQHAGAALTVNLTYLDVVNNTGIGFDDPTPFMSTTLGEARRDTITSVMNYITTQLDPNVYNATVDYQIDVSLNAGGSFLATSGPFFFTSPNGFQNGLVYDHATTGIDPSGGVDATATFDFGHDYHLGTDPTPGDLIDLYSVALHEFTHSMGFLSLVNPDGTSGISNGDPGVFSVFESFFEREDGTDLFGPGGNFLGDSSDLLNDIYFSGEFATFVNGGNRIKIDSSSLSHVDALLDTVMNPLITIGTEEREWTVYDKAMLQDIGWVFAQPLQVPEPGSLLLLGVAVSAMALRRRDPGTRQAC